MRLAHDQARHVTGPCNTSHPLPAAEPEAPPPSGKVLEVALGPQVCAHPHMVN